MSRRQRGTPEAAGGRHSQGGPLLPSLLLRGDACHSQRSVRSPPPPPGAPQAHGRIDILVSNAAVNPTAGPLLSTSAEALDKLWDINVKSAILLAAAARPHMRRGAAIVFMSSMTAYTWVTRLQQQGCAPGCSWCKQAEGRGSARDWSVLLGRSRRRGMRADTAACMHARFLCSVPFPIAAYAITKTALVATSKALSQELGPEGIR